ncbi:Pentatricopeptide repeat-containing protein [Rhynchospora pubera]|uniref:Pentatricopeptide repeat-containing protein n=1 Tax=Rhynchospora pubera TaxID=906938 RepID=A0AAV8EN47_9POAL|nr:Pentatricopeptide repeat-containing protein [Rhynchospora pubera]
MLSVRTVRRICAAVDALAITVIVAGISKSVKKRDFANYAHSANHHPENFPTIASCRAALLKKGKIHQPKPESNNNTGPQDNTNEPAIIKIKKEKDPDKLFSLFQSNACNQIVVENRVIFEDTVSRLAGARRSDLIEQILEHQKCLPQGRREGFVIRIITLYGRARMPDHAIKTFQEMHLFGCKRTVKSFNATLKVLAQVGRFHELRQLFDEAPEIYGIQLDEISYNTLIKVLGEMGSLESAYRAMIEMGKSGVEPDVVTYTTLIAAFYKKGLRKIGDGIWNLMRLRGCGPTLATYNVRIQFLINRCRTFEANSLVRTMYKSGIKPDEVTYNLIIKGFFMMGEAEMANIVFYSMSRRGCQPNQKIYQTMVHYLCEERDFGLAFRFCQRSMEKNWFLDVNTIKKLLKGLTDVSKDRNASEIMRLVVGRIPQYSSDEIMSFQEIISHGRKLKETENGSNFFRSG